MNNYEWTYEKEDITLLNTAIRIYKIYRRSLDPVEDNEFMTFHCHSYYELHYLTKGNYVFHTAEGDIPINEGEAVILPPKLEHGSMLLRDGLESVVFALMIESHTKGNDFFRYCIDSLGEYSLRAFRPCDGLSALMLHYYHMKLGNAEAYLQRKSLACQIICELFRQINGFRCPTVIDRLNGTPEDRAIVMESYLNIPNLRLCEIAKLMGYSTRTLSRKIRDTYGMSFREFKIMRLKETAEKVRKEEPGISMGMLARRIGARNAGALKKAIETDG